MKNMPELKIGVVAVSRDCFPESLSVSRREALIKAYREKYGDRDIYECPICIVESEIHMVQALEDIKAAGCNALVVYLGNFGPEISETLLAKHFDGPKMFVAAAEERGDNLIQGRGDAYCGMLNASYNLKLRNIKDQLIKKYLMEQMEIPDYKADVCVAFAQGNMGRAIMLATSEHFNEIKEEAVHLLREINDMDVDALEAAVKRVVSYKMNITDYLDVISVWYRDVLIYKATKNVDQVVFSDQLRFIKDRASKSSYEGIENILDGIEKAKARLKANVNFELTMELLLLTIKEN